ncbi:hypothetical protein ACFLYP_00265 [Chloroflexota bacterium]
MANGNDNPYFYIAKTSKMVEMVGESSLGESPEMAWQAQFAYSVDIYSAEVWEVLRWGFNKLALAEEAFDRLRLFIRTQSYPNVPNGKKQPASRTLALRCFKASGSSKISVTLLGKVYADSSPTVKEEADNYWHELTSAFPHDYPLHPICSKDEFEQAAGWPLITQSDRPDSFAEILRFEESVSTGEEDFYLIGRWKFSRFGNELIWRVLNEAKNPLLYEVILRPTILKISELTILSEWVKQVQRIKRKAEYFQSMRIKQDEDLFKAEYFGQKPEMHQDRPPEKEGEIPLVKPFAIFASENLADQLENIHQPYVVQIRLISPFGLPEYVPRVVGSTMVHEEQQEPVTPGFQIEKPADLKQAECWRAQSLWLEPDLSPGRIIRNKQFARLRKLVGLNDAQSLFRVPYPPAKGLPGVAFETKTEEIDFLENYTTRSD